MRSLRKRVIRSVPELDGLRPLWNELFRQSPKTLFQSFEWNRLAAAVFSDRLSPLVCAVESDSGAVIIPAAIHHQGNRLELIGEILFDYRDLLHVGDRSVLQIAWQMLAQPGLPLSVTAVQAENAAEYWQEFHPLEFARAPWVDAAVVTADQFRSLHTRAARQLRRMQRKGVKLHQYVGTAADQVKRIYQLKCDQFAADINNVFRDQRRREFMGAATALEAEKCQIFTLEDNVGCIVAGLVTFLDTGIRRFYTIYFDPEWAVYSPGVALVFEATALSLQQGLSCDYMTGEYPYKMRFANATRMLYRVEASAAQLDEAVRSAPKQKIA
jgi:CelD/BcsL family acetyltransferase involved in cellulose biosynthesis